MAYGDSLVVKNFHRVCTIQFKNSSRCIHCNPEDCMDKLCGRDTHRVSLINFKFSLTMTHLEETTRIPL